MALNKHRISDSIRDIWLSISIAFLTALFLNSAQLAATGIARESLSQSTGLMSWEGYKADIIVCLSAAASNRVAPNCGGGGGCTTTETLYVYVSGNNGAVGVGSLSNQYRNGAVLSEPCGYSFWIFAEPDSGYAFTGWSISGDGSIGSGSAANTILSTGTSGGSISLTLNLQQNCILPQGTTVQGSTPTGVYCTNQSYSDQSGQISVGQYQYWFFGPQNGAFNLPNVNYNGPVVPMTHFAYDSVNAYGSWCEDSSGLKDPNGPTMQASIYLTTVGVSGITSEDPIGYWSFGSSGTVSASVGFQGNGITSGISYSYNVPQVEGKEVEQQYYQAELWQQALAMGGCPPAAQAHYFWSYGAIVLSAANSGMAWPRSSFAWNSQSSGSFWGNCGWFGCSGEFILLKWPISITGTG